MAFYENIWAPWRLAYIQNAETAPPKPLELPPGADPDCFVCRAAADDDDRANLVVYRNPTVLVMLNRYPYNNGHLLILPLAHKGRPHLLTDEETLACQRELVRGVALLESRMNAEGFNIGLNLGRIAGAGLPGHLHWHIVPRWTGDVNFMPTLANVRVIPQSLDALWELLHAAWQEA